VVHTSIFIPAYCFYIPRTSVSIKALISIF
jgi:hypothetical protein